MRAGGRPEGVPDEDVDEILAEAARLQAAAEARASDDGRATLAEVQAVARELEIAPAHVEAAVRAHHAAREAARRDAERAKEEREARRTRWRIGGGVVLALGLVVAACTGLVSLFRGDPAPDAQAMPAAEPATQPAAERVREPASPPAPVPPVAPATDPAPAREDPPPTEPVAASDDVVAPDASPEAPDRAAGNVRRVPMAPAQALALRRDVEGAWDLRAYVLRDEGRWMTVPVSRAQERWLFRRPGDFEHSMGDPIAFSGRWTVTEALEGFPSPWEGARVFLLALTEVRGLVLDGGRPRDWHVGVLSEGDLAVFYAGAGLAPDFDAITQGSRFVRGAR